MVENLHSYHESTDYSSTYHVALYLFAELIRLCVYMIYFLYTCLTPHQYLPSWQTGVCWNILEHLLKGQIVRLVYKVTKDTFRKDKDEVITCVSQRTIMSIYTARARREKQNEISLLS